MVIDFMACRDAGKHRMKLTREYESYMGKPSYFWVCRRCDMRCFVYKHEWVTMTVEGMRHRDWMRMRAEEIRFEEHLYHLRKQRSRPEKMWPQVVIRRVSGGLFDRHRKVRVTEDQWYAIQQEFPGRFEVVE